MPSGFMGQGGRGPIVVPATPATFPLSASSNKRYVQTAGGSPLFLHGEAAWSAITNLNDSDQATYIANAASKNFNVLMLELFEHLFSANHPNDANGNAPWTGTAYQSSLGTTYMNRAIAFIRACAARSITCCINPAYAGFGGGSEGWHTELTAASQAQRQAAGLAIGNALKAEPNIMWMKFGDYDPPSHTPYDDIFIGIANSGDTHSLIGNHYTTNESSHDGTGSYGWDYIYQYGGVVSDAVDAGWVANVAPVLLGEAWYELENSSTALDVRRQAWGAFMAGACGHFYGHRDIWGFGNGLFQTGTWQDACNNVSSVAATREQMPFLASYVNGLTGWHLTSPDRSSTFITAGRGTSGTSGYVTARYSSSLGCAYLPTGSTGGAITVAWSVFSAPVDWTWYNVRTGTTNGGATNQTNSGTSNLTAPDGNDWALRVVLH